MLYKQSAANIEGLFHLPDYTSQWRRRKKKRGKAGSLTKVTKVSKESVNYRLGGDHCHACKFFIESPDETGAETGTCKKVAGPIPEHGLCDLFQRDTNMTIDINKVIEELEKRGARHSRADQDMLQAIHDHSVNLGASCDAESAGEDVGEDESAEKYDATVVKVDKNLGLVFGWAIICKKDGKDYYDRNIDKSGEKVPEHIPENSMLNAATDFMESGRVAKDMHSGKAKGSVVFAFPLTTEIAKAMGLKTKVTGLMIAMKPNKELLNKFDSGELKGFSIGGRRIASKMLDLEE